MTIGHTQEEQQQCGPAVLTRGTLRKVMVRCGRSGGTNSKRARDDEVLFIALSRRRETNVQQLKKIIRTTASANRQPETNNDT